MIGSEFVELHLSDMQRCSVRACEIDFVADNIEVLNKDTDKPLKRIISGSIVGFKGQTVQAHESYDDVLRLAKEAEM